MAAHVARMKKLQTHTKFSRKFLKGRSSEGFRRKTTANSLNK